MKQVQREKSTFPGITSVKSIQSFSAVAVRCIIVMLFIVISMLVMVQRVYAADFVIEYKNGRTVKDFPEGICPEIGLALSGGGARGLAHIGVIEVLTENGIAIDQIAGTSIGSIIGGLYAAGYGTDALKDIINDIDWAETFKSEPRRRSAYISDKTIREWPLFELRFEGWRANIPSSLSSGQHINQLLTWLTLGPTFHCNRDFDKLPIPFRSVTTDLHNGETVVIGSGSLGKAIQASSTIPLLFSPVEIDGRVLVDGGLTNNLPVDVVREMGGDIVVAVSIDESMHEGQHLDNPLNVADQATSILMRKITSLSRDAADILITPDVEAFTSRNFNELAGLVAAGRKAALKVLPELQAQINKYKSNGISYTLSEIVVTPESISVDVLSRIDAYRSNDGSISSAALSDAFESLWADGKYLSITANMNEQSSKLSIHCVTLPRMVEIVYSADGAETALPPAKTVMTLHEGKPSLQVLSAAVDSVLKADMLAGFSFASPTENGFDDEEHTYTIEVHVPKISRITLPEKLTSRKTVILREFNFAEGDVLNMNKLMRSLENLHGTGLYRSVGVDASHDRNGVGLTLLLDENKYTVARFGLRYDEYNSTEGRITLTRENILGFGGRFSMTGHTGKRRQLLMLENMSSRIYNSLYTFSAKIFSSRSLRSHYLSADDTFDFQDERFGTMFSLGQQMDKLGNAMFQLRTETIRTAYSPATALKDKNKEFRSFVIRTTIDSYDRYPFPHSGFLNQIYIESATSVLGGSEEYVKLFWNYSQAVTFKRKHTVTASMSFGSADTSTPGIEEFTLGGTATRLNCYNPDTGASHYYADFPGLADEERRGNRLAVAKLGYRLFVPRAFYLDLTYGIGNVWESGSVIKTDTLLQSFGVSGSFVTFLGPLTTGWGITSEGDDRVYLTSGWEF